MLSFMCIYFIPLHEPCMMLDVVSVHAVAPHDISGMFCLAGNLCFLACSLGLCCFLFMHGFNSVSTTQYILVSPKGMLFLGFHSIASFAFSTFRKMSIIV